MLLVTSRSVHLRTRRADVCPGNNFGLFPVNPLQQRRNAPIRLRPGETETIRISRGPTIERRRGVEMRAVGRQAWDGSSEHQDKRSWKGLM